MADKGADGAEIAGHTDKRQMATLVCTLSGALLPFQILYARKTGRCHPKHKFPDGFDIHHTPNHWSNEECSKCLVEKIVIPYVQATRQKRGCSDQKELVIYDVFRGQTMESVHSPLEENNIHVPCGCTDLLQPLDFSVNVSVKSFLHEKFSLWYGDQVRQQLDAAREASDVQVSMQMAQMKKLSAQWLEDVCSCRRTIKSLMGSRRREYKKRLPTHPYLLLNQTLILLWSDYHILMCYRGCNLIV